MKLGVWFLAVAAFAQDAALTPDPAGMLEQARDKALVDLSNVPKYVCVETIDRNYYSRAVDLQSPPSCERIAIDRKKGKDILKLDKSDRLRVAVSLAQGREIYSWTGTAPFSHGVEDILQWGPISTGGFASHLLDIFTSPAVRFRVLDERADAREYGFRVPVEASHVVEGAGKEWLQTGYSGSLRIGRDSLDVRRLTLETDELPPQTMMCGWNTVLEFPGRQTAGAGWFVPNQSRTHEILRDATEIDRVTMISHCSERPSGPPPPPLRQGAPLPPGLEVTLEFNVDIDWDVAAAGDAISATLSLPLLTSNRAVHAGAKVTGRIVRLERQFQPESAFLIAVAFDTLEEKGVTLPFYAKLIAPPPQAGPAFETGRFQSLKLTGQGMENWPYGMFAFPAPKQRRHFIVRAPFQTVWETVSPDRPE